MDDGRTQCDSLGTERKEPVEQEDLARLQPLVRRHRCASSTPPRERAVEKQPLIGRCRASSTAAGEHAEAQRILSRTTDERTADAAEQTAQLPLLVGRRLLSLSSAARVRTAQQKQLAHVPLEAGHRRLSSAAGEHAAPGLGARAARGWMPSPLFRSLGACRLEGPGAGAAPGGYLPPLLPRGRLAPHLRCSPPARSDWSRA